MEQELRPPRLAPPIEVVLLDEISSKLEELIDLGKRGSVTRIKELKDFWVTAEYEIIASKTKGRLHEFMLKGTDKAYRLIITIDGLELFNKTFDETQKIGPYLGTISALEEKGVYILHVKDFSWLKSAYMIIKVERKIRFSHLFSKWDEVIPGQA